MAEADPASSSSQRDLQSRSPGVMCKVSDPESGDRKRLAVRAMQTKHLPRLLLFARPLAGCQTPGLRLYQELQFSVSCLYSPLEVTVLSEDEVWSADGCVRDSLTKGDKKYLKHGGQVISLKTHGMGTQVQKHDKPELWQALRIQATNTILLQGTRRRVVSALTVCIPERQL